MRPIEFRQQEQVKQSLIDSNDKLIWSLGQLVLQSADPSMLRSSVSSRPFLTISVVRILSYGL